MEWIEVVGVRVKGLRSGRGWGSRGLGMVGD